MYLENRFIIFEIPCGDTRDTVSCYRNKILTGHLVFSPAEADKSCTCMLVAYINSCPEALPRWPLSELLALKGLWGHKRHKNYTHTHSFLLHFLKCFVILSYWLPPYIFFVLFTTHRMTQYMH